MSKPSDFFMPEGWDEALALRKRLDKDAVVLAGGTRVRQLPIMAERIWSESQKEG